MSNQHHQEAEDTIKPRLWTHAEVGKALPYLRSIVRSLREHWLEGQRAWLQARRLDRRTGRPDRHALILRAAAARECELAQDRFNEALGELNDLDVYSLDPARGLALIPFRHGDDLDWFVFDLFAPPGLVTRRVHADPLEIQRMLTDEQDPNLVNEVFSSRPWFWKTRPTGQATNLE